MNKIVVAIFRDKAGADEGNLALKKIVAEGISVSASAIIFKNSNNQLSVLEHAHDASHVTAVAALIGGLAGLPGGPLAAAFGAAGGALVGMSAQLIGKGELTKLFDRISEKLASGNAALLADIAEEGMSSFEARMSAMGGSPVKG